MKFKMAENSIFALLLRSPWWVSAGIAATIALIAWAALPAKFMVFGMLSVPFLVVACITGWRRLGAPSNARVEKTLQAARAMSWRDFSLEIERALLRDGFEVTRIDKPEADFSITSSGRTALVSCKRWKAASNGIEPLRDLYKAVQASGAHDCFYITAGEFTQNAMQFAVDKKMRLVHGVALVKLLREMKIDKAKSERKK